MSLETWRKQYAPKKDVARMTHKELFAAHVQLWKGLGKQALKDHWIHKLPNANLGYEIEHGLQVAGVILKGMPLCSRFFGQDATPCITCPLSKARRGIPCNQPKPNEKRSPWSTWTKNGDNTPMLRNLQIAQNKLSQLL